MHITVKTFWLPKAGSTEEEYEDAFAHTPLAEFDGQNFSCAIADGATESSFSGLWASILTRAFVEGWLPNADPPTIRPLALEWIKRVKVRTGGKHLSWYVEEKLRHGSHSSLLGLHLDAEKHCRILCVGDSCLFQFHRTHLAATYPYEYPGQFNNRPVLIATDPAQNEALQPLALDVDWWTGDIFWLATDALAHYFLTQFQSLSEMQWKAQVQERFMRLRSQDAFKTFIDDLRERGLCKNDDTTFVRIRVRPRGK